MEYSTLESGEFDAFATGELTHRAIAMENEIMQIISGYFVKPRREADFWRLVMRRDGLTFQDKIEITRAMVPLFKNKKASTALAALLKGIEDFKAFRNAFAHGVNVTPADAPAGTICIEIVTRSGKEKVITVTTESHEQLLGDADLLIERLRACRAKLHV